MGRCNDDAAISQMVAHQAGEHLLSGGIERRGRLVQQPDWPPHRVQPADRQPPPSSATDPPAGISRPAISRNSEVLPEPLGPVTASAWPEAASKSRLENTSRPPRTQSI